MTRKNPYKNKYQQGGDWRTGMMKAKIATADAMGNTAAHRMVQNYPPTYTWTGLEGNEPQGSTGTHYMGSYGEYAIPNIQQRYGQMMYIDKPSYKDKEAMKFNTPDEAQYFAEHYKDVAPMMRNKQYQVGGKVSTQGYKRGSPDNKAPWLTIPGNSITMSGVPYNVMAYPNNGQQPIMMQPGVPQYQFPGATEVKEVPIRNTVNRMQTIHGTHYQMGGKIKQNPPIYTQQQQEVPTRNYYELPQFQGTTNIVEAGKPWENKPMYLPPTRQNTGTMRAEAPKRSIINKAGQIARHPMTAASYVAQGQPIPDYLEYGEKNKFDNALDIINPMTYIDAGKRTLTAENFRDPNQSFSEALLRTGLDAAMVYGVGKGVKSSVLPNRGTAKFAEPDFVNQHGAKWYSNKPHIYDIDEMGRPIVYERTSGRFTTGDNPSYNALGREEAVSEAQRDAIKNAKFSPEDAKRLKDIKDNHSIYKRDLEEWENYKKTIPEYKQERMQLRPDKQHLSDDAQGVIWTEDGPIYPKNYIHPVDADYINIPARGGVPNGTVYTTNSGKTYQYYNDNFPSGHPVTSEGISSQIHRAEQSARPSMQQIGLDFVPGKNPTTNPLLYSTVLAKDLGKEKKQEVSPEPYSDTPFYLKNNTTEVEKIPEKKKSRKKDTQHIGTGNFTVVGAETPDGQFIYHYPTKEQADSVLKQYGAGGKVKQNPPQYTQDKRKVQAYNDSLNAHDIQKKFQDDMTISWNTANHSFTDKPQYEFTDDFVKGSTLDKRTKLTPYSYDNLIVPYGPQTPQHQQTSIALYKKPVQPYIYQQRDKQNIQQLPISQPNQLPTDIQLQQNLQQVDPYQGANYQYNYNGQFVPDEFHRQLGYPNKQYGGSHTNNNTMKKNKAFPIYGYDDPRMSNMGMVPPYQQGGMVGASAIGQIPYAGPYTSYPVTHNPAAQNASMAFGGIVGASAMGSIPPYMEYGGDCPECDQMKDGGWIQKATAHMRTDKPCTGEKFGSSTCPPGSKRYNLAKTFRKMAKKEYGGDVYQDGGPWGAGTNFNQNLGYNPVLDPANQGTQVDTTGQPIVSSQSPTTAPQVPNAPMAPTQAKKKKNYYNFGNMFNGILDVGMATGSFINGMNNARDVHSQAQQMGLTGNMSHMNPQNVKGDYSQQGYFRPQQNTPANTGMFYPSAQMGGMMNKDMEYQMGGTYTMSAADIRRLRAQGYTIEEL